MRKGGGGPKGGAFERAICVALSLWVSHGKTRDAFWRSAMSGGRATVAARRGIDLANQAGDIVAVAPEGYPLTKRFFVECKHYNDLQLERFFINCDGLLRRFWLKAMKQARQHNRIPLMIAKQDRRPTLLIVAADHQRFFNPDDRACIVYPRGGTALHVYRFDDVIRTPCSFSPKQDKIARVKL